MPLEPEYIVGLDLGQRHDFTALCVAERRRVRADAEPASQPARFAAGVGSYDVVHLERLPLGTPYTDVPARLWALLRAIEGANQARQRPPARTTFVVDQTGVGVAVVDILRAAGLAPVPVVIHGGDAASRGADRSWRVPKRDLVGTVQVLLQGRRLRIAQGLALAPTLVAELANFRASISLTTGHDSYGAAADWREGHHDDLVLATAMACWYGESVRVPVATVGSYFAQPPERGPPLPR